MVEISPRIQRLVVRSFPYQPFDVQYRRKVLEQIHEIHEIHTQDSQSNGFAEALVGITKKLMEKSLKEGKLEFWSFTIQDYSNFINSSVSIRDVDRKNTSPISIRDVDRKKAYSNFINTPISIRDVDRKNMSPISIRDVDRKKAYANFINTPISIRDVDRKKATFKPSSNSIQYRA